MDARDLTTRMAGGVGGWLNEEEDGWRSEVGESYYLDMLRDDARNKAYLDGIERSIQSEAARCGDEGVGVLDIGTGSGLLAMMAKRAGAARVTACECFAPVARSAALCFAANDMSTQVQLVHKASTEMDESEMQGGRRADILVNELYDTELLGEGILPTLRHAIDNLMSERYVVVPREAQVLTVLVESEALCAAHHPQHAKTARGTQLFPGHEPASSSTWVQTYASESIFLDRLVQRGAATIVSGAVLAGCVSFQQPPAHGIHSATAVTLTASKSTTVHAVAYWWDLLMCPGDANPTATQMSGKGDRPSEGVLSMAPGQGFRDHWRQNLCFLPVPIEVEAGQALQLQMVHDDWRFWFRVRALPPAPEQTDPGALSVGDGPEDMCLPRRVYGGLRLRAWADSEIQGLYSEALRGAISGSGVCVGIGDGHLLSLLAAELGAGAAVDVEGTGAGWKLAAESMVAAGAAGERVKVVGLEGAELEGDEGDVGEGGTEEEEEEEEDRMLVRAVRRALGAMAEESEAGLGPVNLKPGPEGRGTVAVEVLMAEPFYLDSSIGAHAGGGGTELRTSNSGGSGGRCGACWETTRRCCRRRRGWWGWPWSSRRCGTGSELPASAHGDAGREGGSGGAWMRDGWMDGRMDGWMDGRRVGGFGGLVCAGARASASEEAPWMPHAGARADGEGRERVKQVEGFDLAAFCDIQPDAAGVDPVAYDLWMYAWKPLSPTLDLLTLDFALPHADVASAVAVPRSGPQQGSEVREVEFSESGTCHGVVVWLDWELAEGVTLSGEPAPHGLHRQKHAVYFLPEGRTASSHGRLRVEEVRYVASDCNVSLQFSVQDSAGQ